MSQRDRQRRRRHTSRNRSRSNRRRALKRTLSVEGLEARALLACDVASGPAIGDFNADNVVNALDYAVWRDSLGSEVTPLTGADASGDGTVGQEDYDIWRTNFGATASTGHHPGGSHPANPAAMALVSLDQATHTVVASGDWSDPGVWQNGVLPTTGARIVIPDGVTLTVDAQIPEEFKTIRIDGALRFATDVDTELRVDTIVSSPTGCFIMGTAASPIAEGVTARVVFADDGAIDEAWDPQQLSRGAVLQGHVSIHGAETTHRVTLATHPAAGATSLELDAAPVGWSVGDQIVITGTQGPRSDEVRTVAAINGTTVQLNQALLLDHLPPKSDLNLYVANTTRNVEFTSENTTVERRGHMMFMHNNDVRIKNAAFNELGRTDKLRELDDVIFDFGDDSIVGNKTSAGVVFTTEEGPRTNIRGRYAIHFHRGGVDPSSPAALIEGSVVNGSPGWGFVNHSSHVNIVNNVAYGVHGASFYTEAGDEVGSIVGNIAIRIGDPNFTLTENGTFDVDLRAEFQDFGVDGDGYWLSGHLVSMRDNVSAGATGHGFIIWSDGLVEADRGRTTVSTANIAGGHLITGRDTIPTWWAPMAEISGNESYSASIGFRSRYVHSQGYLGEIGSAFHTPPDQAYIDTLNPTIDGLTVWGSRDGALLNYNERLSITNSRLIGVGAPYFLNDGTTDTGVGIDMGNVSTRGPGVIENVTIEGFNMGLIAPRNDGWTLSNLDLRNTTDLRIVNPNEAPRVLDMTGVTFGPLAGTAVAGQEASRQNVVLVADIGANEFQPFAFLMSDRITLDGQQIYYDQQAADFDPTDGEIAEFPGPVPPDMLGLTNEELVDRFGTSFGGAIIPDDATSVGFVSGGVVGSVAPPAATSPPIYHPASETAGAGVIIDPGTLTNFGGGAQSQAPVRIADVTSPQPANTGAPVTDLNGDGVVDTDDFGVVVAQMQGVSPGRSADYDRDGDVDRADFEVFLAGFAPGDEEEDDEEGVDFAVSGDLDSVDDAFAQI